MDLITIAKAQGADEIASPTIPFTPPTGGTAVPSVSVVPTGPRISLESFSTSVAVGQKIKVSVIIDTQGTPIKEFTFQVTFDPLLWQIIDTDPATSNIEITYKDTYFLAKTNSASQALGTINVNGSTEQEPRSVTNRIVAEFELQALRTGFAQINLVKENSLLVNANSLDILQSTNNLSITITEIGVTISGVPSGTPGVLPSKTPDTALIDDLAQPSSILIGAFLIAAGFYLLRRRKNNAKV